ncbi:MAG: class I SAM-dependent methyltransferase [Hyphomicrobium sp.]
MKKTQHPLSPTAKTASILNIVNTEGFFDYRLLDCGGGRKLEQFGSILINRPELQALWSKTLSDAEWNKAHAIFAPSSDEDERGRWRIDRPIPDDWRISVNLSSAGFKKDIKISMYCKLQGLWHIGIFPEQYPHWVWMLDQLQNIKDEQPRVLNLFGYTGAASIIAAAVGADVTHLDASKKTLAWAKENQRASSLEQATIRWMLDDAKKFVARELRRGKTYHFILIDPPKFGRGPNGEVWDLFRDLPEFLIQCKGLLCDQKSAFILTVYAIRASVLSFDQLVREVMRKNGGIFDSGELALLSESGKALPTSLFTRWTSFV